MVVMFNFQVTFLQLLKSCKKIIESDFSPNAVVSFSCKFFDMLKNV